MFDLCSLKTFNRPQLPSGDGSFSDRTIPQSRIPESYVSSVLSRIVDALEFMHEKANVVHLDIKVCLIWTTFLIILFLNLCIVVVLHGPFI